MKRAIAPTISVSAAATLALVATVACEKNDRVDTPAESPSPDLTEEADPIPVADTPQPTPPPADGDIKSAIERELLVDGSVPASQIHVTVNDGIAELTGTVNSLMAKNRAVRLAQMVKGVRSVSDRIELDVSAFPSGEKLADDVRTALILDPATDAYELTVSADGHTVSLVGTVESHQERMLSELVASGVAGVAEVDNDIVVDWPKDRADVEVRADIESRLRWDALVEGALIDVDVKDGKAVLSGTVGSMAEKSRAILDAWVIGVKDVDADKLDVARWARDPDLRADKYTADITDGKLRQAILDAAVYDPRVSSFDIDVSVNAGVATLSGDVSSERARNAAADLARNTVGVISVINNIRVAPTEEVTDEKLRERALSALALDPITESYEIDIGVEDGTVTLKGEVDSFFEKAQAEHVIAGLAGAKDITNELDVESPTQAFVYDAYLSPFYPHVYTLTYVPVAITKSDAELLDDVGDELFWSPFVDKDEITVSVENGEVTLTGVVDSWLEYNSATENAYEAGALSVENRLQVR